MKTCPLFFRILNQIPVATIQPYAYTTDVKNIKPPKGWLLCDGSKVSAIDYTELSIALFNMFYSKDEYLEYDEFFLPDMSELYIFPVDNIYKHTGQRINSENPEHIHEAFCEHSGEHSHEYETHIGCSTQNGSDSTGLHSFDSWIKNNPLSGEHEHKTTILETSNGGLEFNPRSMYLTYIIKY